jgi:hypothetical protein
VVPPGRTFRDYDALVIRTDRQGNELWTKTLGASDHDGAYAVLQPRTGQPGDFLVAGEKGNRPWLALLDEEYTINGPTGGTVKWERTYEGALWAPRFGDEFVVENRTGGFTLAAQSPGGFTLIRTHDDGTVKWKKEINEAVTGADGPSTRWGFTGGGTLYNGVNALVGTCDDGFLLVGTRSFTGFRDPSDPDTEWARDEWIALVRLDSDGNFLWTKEIEGHKGDASELYLWDGALSAVRAPNRGFVLSGYTQRSDTEGGDGTLPWHIRLDGSGERVWDLTTHDRWNGAVSRTVAQTPTGGYISGGDAGLGAGVSDEALHSKLSAEPGLPVVLNGDFECCADYWEVRPHAIEQEPSGNKYLQAWSHGSGIAVATQEIGPRLQNGASYDTRFKLRTTRTDWGTTFEAFLVLEFADGRSELRRVFGLPQFPIPVPGDWTQFGQQRVVLSWTGDLVSAVLRVVARSPNSGQPGPLPPVTIDLDDVSIVRSGAAPSPNLITNATFDRGLGGWKGRGHVRKVRLVRQAPEPSVVRDAVARLTPAASASTFLSQTIKVTPGGIYSASVRIATRNLGAKAFLRLRFRDVHGVALQDATSETPAVAGTTALSQFFTERAAPPDAATVEVQLQVTSGKRGAAFFDDVVLTAR